MPYGVPIPKAMKNLLLKQSLQIANQVEEGLHAEFVALAKKFKLTLTEKPLYGQSASTSWVEEQGRQVDIIKHHGRLADLICVAKPDVDRSTIFQVVSEPFL